MVASTTEFYTYCHSLSLRYALPISLALVRRLGEGRAVVDLSVGEIGGPAFDKIHDIEGRADDPGVSAAPVADRVRDVGAVEGRQYARLAQHALLAAWRGHGRRAPQD